MNNQHKAGILFSEKTRSTYESILAKIKDKIETLDKETGHE